MLKCTCVLRCTSNRPATLFCKGQFGVKNITKCTPPTIFTKVHKYTGRFWRQFLEQLFNKMIKKVVKSSELMNISEFIESFRRFLPCSLIAILWSSVLQKRAYTLKYTNKCA